MRYTIDTKAAGFQPGCLKRDAILASAKGSFEDLQTFSVSAPGFGSWHASPDV